MLIIHVFDVQLFDNQNILILNACLLQDDHFYRQYEKTLMVEKFQIDFLEDFRSRTTISILSFLIKAYCSLNIENTLLEFSVMEILQRQFLPVVKIFT